MPITFYCAYGDVITEATATLNSTNGIPTSVTIDEPGEYSKYVEPVVAAQVGYVDLTASLSEGPLGKWSVDSVSVDAYYNTEFPPETPVAFIVYFGEMLVSAEATLHSIDGVPDHVTVEVPGSYCASEMPAVEANGYLDPKVVTPAATLSLVKISNGDDTWSVASINIDSVEENGFEDETPVTISCELGSTITTATATLYSTGGVPSSVSVTNAGRYVLFSLSETATPHSGKIDCLGLVGTASETEDSPGEGWEAYRTSKFISEAPEVGDTFTAGAYILSSESWDQTRRCSSPTVEITLE